MGITSALKEADWIRQQVNPWLCIALLGLMTFWTLLYYTTHKAQAIGDNSVAAQQAFMVDIPAVTSPSQSDQENNTDNTDSNN